MSEILSVVGVSLSGAGLVDNAQERSPSISRMRAERDDVS
jgi:hypothetical protein